MKIFIAGATGVIGLPLVRRLCAMGHQVTGMTRKGPGAIRLLELGAKVSYVDAFDADAVYQAMAEVAPDVVIDQLTLLPSNPADILTFIPEDTRLHREGGGNIFKAATALGVTRYILQSRAFYLAGPEGQLTDERADLDINAPGVVGESCRVMHRYEQDVLDHDGVVLRYGFFYGPNTWYRPDGAIAEQAQNGEMLIIGEGNAVWSFIHIDDAIEATIAALNSPAGIFNIVDDDPLAVSDWMPAFARWVNAAVPKRISLEEGLGLMGEAGVYYHTQLRGATNEKAKNMLAFSPRPLLWK